MLGRRVALALLVAGIAACVAAAQENAVDALIAELSGDKAVLPGDAGFEAVCVRALNGLIPAAGVERIEDRAEPQRALERICALAGRPDAEARRVVLSKALAGRLGGNAPVAAKACVLRLLERIGGEEAVSAVAPLLNDPSAELRDAARRTLMRISGSSAAAALRVDIALMDDAQMKAARLDAFAFRGDAEACELALELLAAKQERRVVLAAIAAAAATCGESGIDPLHKLTLGGDSEFAEAAVAALLRMSERFAQTEQKPLAERIAKLLSASATESFTKAAALRAWARVDPQGAMVEMVHAAKDDSAPELQAAVVRIAGDFFGGTATKALWTLYQASGPALQAIVIGELADHEDAAPLLVEAAKSNVAVEVRAAAIRGLGAARGAGLAVLVERVTAEEPERSAAREALRRAGGVDMELLALLSGSTSAAARQAEIVAALADRDCDAALPAFYKLTESPDEVVRIAAIHALGQRAAPSDLPRLIAIMENTSDANREAAEDMLVAVAQRDEDRQRRIEPLLAEMHSGDVRFHPSLVRVLGRLGGPAALEVLRQARREEEHAEVLDAAVRALANWPTPDAMDDLLAIALEPASPVHASLAIRGYMRLLAIAGDRPEDEKTGQLTRLLQRATTPEDRRVVLGSFATLRDPAALAVIRPLVDDEAVGNEAALAAIAIAMAIAPDSPDQSSAALRELDAVKLSDAVRRQLAEVRGRMKSREGFLGAWRFAGPFQREGKKGPELIDIAFPPETPSGDTAAWKPLRAGDKDDPWMADFTRIDRGANRCIYVRTRILSPKAQPARLELGSDDGVKVWLNGDVVHRVEHVRGLTPGEDRVAIELKEGWNTLLVKVVQEAGGWGLLCALRDADGGQLAGVRVSAE